MHTIEVLTSARQSFHDITDEVRAAVAESGVDDGLCIVFCPHTTAGLTLNENWDPDVRRDLALGLDAVSPQRADYDHDEGNSPAHLKSSLVGASETVLIESGRLVLGTWQGIYLIEFDGPRRRKIHVKALAA